MKKKNFTHFLFPSFYGAWPAYGLNDAFKPRLLLGAKSYQPKCFFYDPFWMIPGS
jgi:hypothetical protein